jgi:hypothetical protein
MFMRRLIFKSEAERQAYQEETNRRVREWRRRQVDTDLTKVFKTCYCGNRAVEWDHGTRSFRCQRCADMENYRYSARRSSFYAGLGKYIEPFHCSVGFR